MSSVKRIKEEIFQLYSEIDLGQLLNKIAEKIKLLLGCEEASIFVYNPVKEQLYFEIATGEKGRSLKEITLRLGEGIAGWIAQHREALIINDCSNDPRFAGRFDRTVHFVTRSILGVPVIMDGTLLGVMEAINKTSGKFTARHREVLEGIGQFVSIPLQNAILFKKILQETKEKEQLLLLGKKISAALSTGEIFSSLKQIINEIMDPTSIRIFVRSEDRIYDLISGSDVASDDKLRVETSIMPSFLRFPLHTGRGDFGFLEISTKGKIPDVSASLVRGLAAYVAITTEKFVLYQQMVEKERVTKELEIARDIQQSFLPPPGVQSPGMDLAYLNLSSSAVGGDYYEVLPLEGGRLIVSINDVSGHGVPASLLMSIFRTSFIYQMKKEPDLVKTLGLVNDLIAETTTANHYVTSFTAQIDREAGCIRYVNAGHPSPLLVRGGDARELPSNCMVIGLMSGAAFKTEEVPLEPGDTLVLYTDGVIEAENGRGEEFGMARLTAFCRERGGLSAEVLKDQLIAELERFTGTKGFTDDVTLLIARLLPA